MPRAVAVPAEERLRAHVAVLDAVRRGHAGTRAALVEATGLSRAVVAQRVGELLERGLLVEGDLAASTGGRAPRTLRFGAEAGHLLVAALGATSIDVGVTDLDGTVLAHAAEPADVAAGPDAVLGRVDELFRACLAEVDDLPGELWAIGVGVPGPVEFEAARPVSPPIMPGWDGYAVRDRFADYGAPLWLDNDVNLMALGEARSGIARGHDDVVFVKIGTGIGAGILVGGRLHRGARGAAGDLGHVAVVDGADAVVCRCGNLGCLEALAGGAAIARDAESAARAGRSARLAHLLEEKGSLEARDVADAATHGDPVARELLATAGRLVGQALAATVNVLNPSLVVVGGGVAASGDLLLATIRESVYRRSLPLATRDLLVTRSALDDDGVTGAAAMVTDELFAPPRLAQWLDAGTPRVLAAD